MKTAHKSDIGRIRMINEDRSTVQMGMNGLTLAIVADGMGGHQAGDIASQLAIEVIQKNLQGLQADLAEDELFHQVQDAIRKANHEILQCSIENKQFQGMGTTVVVAVATDQKIYISHIGDSRAYKVSTSGFIQLTEDHSLVNELVKRGQLSPEEADDHPRRNVLTQALGTDEHINIDSHSIEWTENEIILLCSDGLSNMVVPDQMMGILQSEHELDWKVDRLIECALEAGGDDNVTVVLLSNDNIEGQEGGEA